MTKNIAKDSASDSLLFQHPYLKNQELPRDHLLPKHNPWAETVKPPKQTRPTVTQNLEEPP